MFDGRAASEMHSDMSLFRMGILPLCRATAAVREIRKPRRLAVEAKPDGRATSVLVDGISLSHG